MNLGKTFVITGVSSGIGARTAELAIAQGADVIGIDMKEPASAGNNFIKGDLSSPAGIDAVVKQLPQRFDALLNVAGVSGKIGAEATLAINFYGLRAFTEALAPRIREGGSVVNVASIAGYGWRANLDRAKAMVGVQGFPDIKAVMEKNGVGNEIGYPLSKELLLLWTQKAAHEVLFKGRGIRVNAVSPGPVETQILKEFRSVLGDERVDSDISRVGRAATASDIAPVILFLASDAARWINGANIANDGGLEASINADVLGF
ncbi:MAG: putative 3-alpha-hydroxysteroid dehydrogenase protein [Rhizobium sp.]|nr:putative 3-alpha-hydroxysteroid dehydrogenase protein [Rhizobium sp.]